MNKNPMIDQVNRLIANRLAAGGEYYLPGVGSLYVEKRSARQVSRQEVEPPYCAVCFSSQELGVSLVDEIARAAHCESETAQSIYDRWLENVTVEDGLVIEGVGELHSKFFTPDPSFEHVLNPQGHAPVQVKRRKYDWALWIGAIAILVALGVGYFVYTERDTDWESSMGMSGSEVAEQPDATLPADSLAAQTPVVVEPAVPVPAILQYAVEPSGSAEAPASLVSGRHYVVAGVYSVPANAARAAAAIDRMDPAFRCGIYRFGSKLMVAPFVSDDLAACNRFKAEYRDRFFQGLWNYTGR